GPFRSFGSLGLEETGKGKVVKNPLARATRAAATSAAAASPSPPRRVWTTPADVAAVVACTTSASPTSPAGRRSATSRTLPCRRDAAVAWAADAQAGDGPGRQRVVNRHPIIGRRSPPASMVECRPPSAAVPGSPHHLDPGGAGLLAHQHALVELLLQGRDARDDADHPAAHLQPVDRVRRHPQRLRVERPEPLVDEEA